jgi:hypothetical protein
MVIGSTADDDDVKLLLVTFTPLKLSLCNALLRRVPTRIVKITIVGHFHLTKQAIMSADVVTPNRLTGELQHLILKILGKPIACQFYLHI